MKNMWVVLEFVFLAAIVLLAVTEFFYPLLAGKPLFGSFRRKGQPAQPMTMDERIAQAARKAAEVKDVQRRVDEDLRKAEQRKNAADDLL